MHTAKLELMSLRDLTYIISAAELKSFTRAASANNVSQPTLSIQIKKYEKTLGFNIFERSKREISLTPEGEFVITRAKQILNINREIENYSELLRDPESGQLHLGAFSSIASYILPVVGQKINKNFSKLKLFLIEEKTETLDEQLSRGEIDCAILAEGTLNKASNNNFEAKKLFKDNFYLAVNKEHVLAKKKTIKLSQISEYSLILLTDGHCLQNQVSNVCQLAGIREENFQATSMTTLLEMVRLGTGITLIPDIARKNHPELCYIRIVNPSPARQINFYYSKFSNKKELLEKIYNKLKSPR